ncbi:MAG: ABC transporter permease DevC [Pirellulaceae bacterium]|nr:ABC transporter permease DevC [Pirellulaceae bacterium]
MIFSRNSFVAIGWSQLSHGKTRMIVALCGVSVIVAMILTVLSLKDAVIESTLQVPKSLKGDVIVMSARTQTILRPAPFPRRFLDRLHGIDGVAAVSSVAIENARWINPETRQEHPIRVFGLDLEFDVIALPGIDPGEPRLKMKDTIIFDASSRPKFGPVAQRFKSGQGFSTEVNGRRVDVCGLTYAGVSIAADGNLFTTHANFQRLFPNLGGSRSHIGVIRLKASSSQAEVARQVREMLGSEARVLTRTEMMEAEKAFMKLNDPVDDIMGMIASVAFFVGMIIVYQILYTDVVNHLPQFATLKAIGFTGFFLLGIILAEGVILSLLGFGPGLIMAHGLTILAQHATLLPVTITLSNTFGVLLAAISMCVFAASIAVRKITQAEPASVF